MSLIETERLALRRLEATDAPFILRLLNEPSFLRFIGDRGVRTPADAERYILDGPVASYESRGFGLYLVTLREDHAPIGLCGLLQREALEHPDIGFAYLPEYWGRGYALEAARAVLAWGRDELGLGTIVAVVSPGNSASIRVLEKLGLRYGRTVRLSPKKEDEVQLFVPVACGGGVE